ncbi:hypothetical protein SVAN01_04843 [Stagonosporopsis vannaccii]|nr:hypothetical protein SVAN01_04843 [Stagonosporopsis vannaccii]
MRRHDRRSMSTMSRVSPRLKSWAPEGQHSELSFFWWWLLFVSIQQSRLHVYSVVCFWCLALPQVGLLVGLEA